MKKISTKLNIAMLLLTGLILALVGAVLIINMDVDYHREFEQLAKRTCASAELETAAKDGTVTEYLDSQLELFNQSCEYYLFEKGNIVASSKQGGILTMTPVLSQALSLPASEGKKALDYAFEISDGRVVYFIDSKGELYENIFEMSLLFLQALFFAIILAAVISFFISKRLTHSIKELEKGAKRLAEGEFAPVTVKAQDETASLCNVFNEMAEQIQTDYDRFEKQEESRREFVANVSHELKTPLTVIKSYSETLRKMEVDDKTRNKFLSVIDSEVDKMTDIVGQLLQLSKLEEPITAPPVHTDIQKLCREIAAAFEIEAGKKGVTITVSGEGFIETDRQKLRAILTNLVSNAVKYCFEKSEISIDITQTDVTISNYGAGISQKDLPHIFERFYRTDPARNRGTGGTGLGLAIVKESADAISAKISAVSSEDGLTQFRLEF